MRVILKLVEDESSEISILKFLKELKGPTHHIIELLDVVKLSVGTMIVLPRHMSLPHALPDYPDGAIFAHQFLKGVAFTHEHSVVHLDLKPDNVVVKQNSLIKVPTTVIIDFDSLVKVDSVEETIEGMCGTPSWIAPEITAG